MVSEDAREVIEEFSQGYEIRVNVPPENPGEAFKEQKGQIIH